MSARGDALAAHRGALRDAVDNEVQQAYEDCVRSDAAIRTTAQAIESATEAYRLAHEGFLVGRVSSTTLTDVETELTKARLAVIDAQADARIARVMLELATGRATRALRWGAR